MFQALLPKLAAYHRPAQSHLFDRTDTVAAQRRHHEVLERTYDEQNHIRQHYLFIKT